MIRTVLAAALAATVLAAGPARADMPLLDTVPAVSRNADSPIAAGKQLFEENCGACHELARPLAKQGDRAAWEATVKQMIANGAHLDEAGGRLVVGYLTAKSAFETRCNVCHDLDRPLAAIKDTEQWRATVNRMAAMKPGAISEPEAGAIALYLSLVAPVKK